MIQLYAHEVGPENHKRITNLVAAYPYLLRQHIRPGCLCSDDHDIPEPHRLLLHEQRHIPHETRHEGQESSSSSSSRSSSSSSSTRIRTPSSSDSGAYDCWVDKRALPWSLFLPQSLPAIARTENRPLWVCDRMAALICQISYGPNFTSRERLCLLGMVDKLTNAVGQCERIHQTAVPLNYARHSLRSLTLWLFTLPFCLVNDLGWFTAPANAAIAWLFFGVYQIGYSIEDPFQGSLRLSILCDAIRRSVIRQTTDTMDDSSASMDGYSGSHRPSDPLWAGENPDSTPSSVRNEFLTSAPPSSSSNASKIADAIKRRRWEQQQQDRDLKASQHQLEEGCDDNAVVEPLREQRPSPRVTADMAKSLQEEIQQQLYQPTLSPQKKSSSATPPTTSDSAALLAPSDPSVSPPRTTMAGTTTDAASSSSTLPPSSAAAEPLSTPPPPPLWMEEELLQAPKIVRRHANGTWTDVGI
jgi:Bestrophin, RFP-TM, chloride channel